MPNFYNFLQDGLSYSFDDVFVPADAFRQGNLWTWGDNYSAQLGTNNSTPFLATGTLTPVTTFAGGANWKQFAGGSSFTAAIKTDGTLWTWGRNNNGQLGTNTTTTRSTPVTTFAGGNNWKQVDCGLRHTGAIKTDGTLWTWGSNYNTGSLGNNQQFGISCTPITTFAGGNNWKQVSCGYHTAAIKTDGTLWVWGYGGLGSLGTNSTSSSYVPITTFAGGTDWKQVSCSVGSNYSVTAAIKTDGTLWVWGDNSNGQLGDNTIINRSTPVTTFAGGINWKQVSCGPNRHMAAIKTDGTLWTWGRNSGALGDNTIINRSTPVTTFAGGTNWKQVSCGGYNTTAAIKTDGTLWTWGFNYGRLGTNDTTYRSTPVTTFAGGANWKEVNFGNDHVAAVTYIDDYQ